MKTYNQILKHLKVNQKITKYVAGSDSKYIQIMQHTLDTVAFIYEKEPIDVLNDFADIKID